MKEENGRFLFETNRFGTKSVQAILAKAGFNPAQLRDDRGWWSRVGGQAPLPAHPEQIQYRGYSHDVVVDHLIRNLTDRGLKAIKNVNVFGISGVLAIPDGAT